MLLLLLATCSLTFAANSDRLQSVSQSKQDSSEFLSRQKRLVKEIFIKTGPPYRQYCREDLKELILYACPLKRRSPSLFELDNYNPMRCNIYEEAREKPYPLGAGERGEEFDEEASSMRSVIVAYFNCRINIMEHQSFFVITISYKLKSKINVPCKSVVVN